MLLLAFCVIVLLILASIAGGDTGCFIVILAFVVCVLGLLILGKG